VVGGAAVAGDIIDAIRSGDWMNPETPAYGAAANPTAFAA
jgi:hypothetical protein